MPQIVGNARAPRTSVRKLLGSPQAGVLQVAAASTHFAVRQNGEKANTALWPPNPSEFDSATFCG